MNNQTQHKTTDRTGHTHVVSLLARIAATDQPMLAERIATHFGISADRAHEVLQKDPGALTKPSSHAEARRIASALINLGLAVEVVTLEEHRRGVNTSDPTATEPPAVIAERSPIAPSMTRQKPGLRFGLQAKLVTTTILPVLLIAIGALAILWPTVQRGYDRLLSSSAAEIAHTIAFSLDINDPAVSAAEIMLVTHRKDVGFIRVDSQRRDSVQFFAKDPISRFEGWLATPRSDTTTAPTGSWIVNLAQRVRTLDTTSGGQRLEFRDDRPALVRQQLISTPNAELQAELESLKPYEQRPVSYMVQQANVYRAKNGNRTVLVTGESDAAPDPKVGKLAYSLQIGLLDDSARALQRDQLHLLLGLTGLTLLVAGAVAAIFARRMSQRILSLTGAADRISLGELETPVSRNSVDELGDLGAALERMRLSLKISMERLRRR